jgi:hypothetical protein
MLNQHRAVERVRNLILHDTYAVNSTAGNITAQVVLTALRIFIAL